MASARRTKTAPRTSRRGKYDRSRSSAERQADQRSRLLDAAVDVFADKGFAHSTVELIVDRAGMSRRTFYEQFESLRDCLAQVYARTSVATYTLVERNTRAPAEPLARIREGITAYLTAIASAPATARVILQEYRRGGPDFEMRYQLDTTRYAGLLFESLSNAHSAGCIAQAPTEIAVYLLTCGIEAVAMREVARGEPRRLLAITPEIVELVLARFGHPETPGS